MRSSAASAVMILAIDAGRYAVWMSLPSSTRPVSASTRIQATGAGVVGRGGRPGVPVVVVLVVVVVPAAVVVVAASADGAKGETNDIASAAASATRRGNARFIRRRDTASERT